VTAAHNKELAELAASYKSGKVTAPLMLDNDSTTVYEDRGEGCVDYVKVFDMDPHDLLEAALDLLGIPHEHV
jgi:hypothetical protein